MRNDQIQDLVALGLSPEMLAKVLKIVTRPSSGALRTRRWRDRKASHVTSPETRHSDVTEPPLKNPPLTKTNTEEVFVLAKPPKRLRHTMAEDWQPSEKAFAKLREKGFEKEQITHEAERMRNHFLANNQLSTNWDLNFYNWMDRSDYGTRPFGRQPAQANLQRHRKTVCEAAKQLHREAVLNGNGHSYVSPLDRLLERARNGGR